VHDVPAAAHAVVTEPLPELAAPPPLVVYMLDAETQLPALERLAALSEDRGHNVEVRVYLARRLPAHDTVLATCADHRQLKAYVTPSGAPDAAAVLMLVDATTLLQRVRHDAKVVLVGTNPLLYTFADVVDAAPNLVHIRGI